MKTEKKINVFVISLNKFSDLLNEEFKKLKIDIEDLELADNIVVM